MNLVIVESPAKAKTINKYLGSDYEVLASYGHVRDLPSKDGSVLPDDDFSMHWEADAKGAKRLSEIAEAAKRSAQCYVNARWLGGMLTNWKTISGSIRRLRHLDDVLSSADANAYTKKERLELQRERDKLNRSLGGIKDMGGIPDLIFVIDTNKEDIAISEARRLGIPVAAVVDTNCNPDGITFVVPGNDDAARAITLYCDLIARAALDGISRGQGGILIHRVALADAYAAGHTLYDTTSGKPVSYDQFCADPANRLGLDESYRLAQSQARKARPNP